MKCPECGVETRSGGESQTLVGFMSPVGHDHDDNCRKRPYKCVNGHFWQESKQNRCSTPGCTWVGSDECFCHPGKKVKEWTDSNRGPY